MLNFTHIYEHARAALDITRDEYALCNFIQVLSAHPNSSRPGWCDSTREQKAAFVGLSLRGLDKMEAKMCSLGLLEKERRHTRTTQKWWQTVQEAKLAPDEKHQESAQSAGLNSGLDESAQSAGLPVLQSAQSAGKKGTKCTLKAHKVQPLSNVNNKEKGTAVFSFGSRPNATTPDALFEALGTFYKEHTQEWSTGIMENSKGKAWSQEELGHIVRNFCRWAVENNRGGDTYQQLNARLQRWFADQYLRRQSGQTLAGASSSSSSSNNPAFKPL